MTMRTSLCLAALLALPLSAPAGLPACLAVAEGESIEATVRRHAPGEPELLARLVHAEGRSTGHPRDPLVYEGIAWGEKTRVRLAARSPTLRRRYGDGLAGVVFRKGQFNPAVSPRSRFSRELLCPSDPATWRLAETAAARALAGKGNPFVQTGWERRHGLSLVVNFYYPASEQARGPHAPWEGDAALHFIGAVQLADGVLPAERIRFYRLSAPPRDLPDDP
jgi:hypothetical protein